MKTGIVIAKAAHASAAHPLIAGSGAALMGASCLALAMAIGRPGDAQGREPAAAMVEQLSPPNLVVFDGVRRLVDSCAALIAAPKIGVDDRQALLLWISDDRDRGRVNGDELLVLVHSPLLETIEAVGMWEAPPEAAAEALASGDLFGPGAIERWRGRADVASNVIATAVTAFQVEQSGRSPDSTGLTVRLTFAVPSSDDTETASFHLRLPAVHSAAGGS